MRVLVLVATLLALLGRVDLAHAQGSPCYAGNNCSLGSVTASGATSGQTLAAIAANGGVYLDAFYQAGDADYTAALNRAVAAGVPILLGPKTYQVHDFSSGAVASFMLRGIPGKSVIQRASASTSSFFGISATTVVIDGVTFDMNDGSVSANQWGVLLNGGGQNVTVKNSVFKNNNGSLGSCFALLSTGPAAGGSFIFDGNEVTGCTFNPLYFGSVSNGRVAGNYIHDNSTTGLYISSYTTASATNYATDIIVAQNRFMRNSGSGVAVGGFGPPYTFGTPGATWVSVNNNLFEDNTGYQIALQGDHLMANENIIRLADTTASGTSFGGIDCNARWLKIESNKINLPGASYGIDCGGAVEAHIAGNKITMTTGTAIDPGGTQNAVVENNSIFLSGSASAMGVLAVEGPSGAGNYSFPTVTSGLVIRRNQINMNGSNTRGIQIWDNAGGYNGSVATQVINNDFIGSNSASTYFAISFFAASTAITIHGNTWNGGTTAYSDPNANGDVLFDNVFDEVRGYSSTAAIRMIAPNYISTYGAGASVLYVYPTSGGSGYGNTTTTVSVSGPGCTGWAGTPQINNGVILAIKTTAMGSGCTGAVTATVTDAGGGTGATLTAVTTPALPAYRHIRYFAYSSTGNLLKTGGAYIALASEPSPLQLTGYTPIELVATQSGSYWSVLGYRQPTYAVGSLPTCNSTESGAMVNVSGSVTGKWHARCNGTNWIWSDGTTVSN